MRVPTDRSMPPVMMTKVHAMASTPLTAVACRMLTRLSVCRKLDEAMLKTAIRTMRLAKASSFCRAEEAKRRERRPVAGPRGAAGCASADEGTVLGSMDSPRRHGFALSGQLHDLFLRRLRRVELTGEPAFAHDDDPVAHAQDLGQLRRDHDDGAALLAQRVEQLVDLGLRSHVD